MSRFILTLFYRDKPFIVRSNSFCNAILLLYALRNLEWAGKEYLFIFGIKKIREMKNDFFKNIGLAVLRIVPSLLIMTHGYGKLKNLIAGNFEFADPIGLGDTPSLFLAVIGEFVCPILIIIGFKTRLAAIPAAITMLVASFIVHGQDPLGDKELPLLFLTIFVVIMLVGPGKYSVDKK